MEVKKGEKKKKRLLNLRRVQFLLILALIISLQLWHI